MLDDPAEHVPERSERPLLNLLALARQSAVYALGGFAYKGLAILAVPLLARLLSPPELGLLDAAAITASLLGLVAGLGTEQGVAWMESRVADERQLWASALAMVGALSLLIVGVAAVAREPLALVLTGEARHGNVVLLAAGYGGVMAFTAAALNVIRLRSTPTWYAVGSFAVVTAEMVAALASCMAGPGPRGVDGPGMGAVGGGGDRRPALDPPSWPGLARHASRASAGRVWAPARAGRNRLARR